METETKWAGLTVAQLRKCALYIQGVATTAATAEQRAALERLANRLWAVAMERAVVTALNLCWPAPSETAGWPRLANTIAVATEQERRQPTLLIDLLLAAELEARAAYHCWAGCDVR